MSDITSKVAVKGKGSKPSVPTSVLNVENLIQLEDFLILRWRELVEENTSLLEGVNAIELFDLDKLRDRKLCEIKRSLAMNLPDDIYAYLKYQRRVELKKSERHQREGNECSSTEFYKADITVLENLKYVYSNERVRLLQEISFFAQALQS